MYISMYKVQWTRLVLDWIQVREKGRYFCLDQLGRWSDSLKQAKVKEAHVWRGK